MKRHLFIKDYLALLWFCLSLNSLSRTPSETRYGFNIKEGNPNYKGDKFISISPTDFFINWSKP